MVGEALLNDEKERGNAKRIKTTPSDVSEQRTSDSVEPTDTGF